MQTLAEFVKGFADASGIGAGAANVYWAVWTHDLSQSEREELERGGYRAGHAEGERWRMGLAPPKSSRPHGHSQVGRDSKAACGDGRRGKTGAE